MERADFPAPCCLTHLSLYTERSYTWTGVPFELSKRAGGGCSCVLRRLIQEYVWNVYDHR